MRSDFVLESVSSARQINLSPLNTSTSKHLYSFSRDSRFKLPPPYCDNIYDIPSFFQRTHSSANKSRTKFNSTHLSFRGDVTPPPRSDSTIRSSRLAPHTPCAPNWKSSTRKCPSNRKTTTPAQEPTKIPKHSHPAAATSSLNTKIQESPNSIPAHPNDFSKLVLSS